MCFFSFVKYKYTKLKNFSIQRQTRETVPGSKQAPRLRLIGQPVAAAPNAEYLEDNTLHSVPAKL